MDRDDEQTWKWLEHLKSFITPKKPGTAPPFVRVTFTVNYEGIATLVNIQEIK